MRCIICNCENFKKVLEMPELYQSVFLDSPEDIDNVPKTCVDLNECQNCKFIQMSTVLNQDDMYRKYYYRSGANNSMVSDLRSIVYNCFSYFGNKNKHYNILETGTNDGTMMRLFDECKPQNSSLFKVGFDPANNLYESATKYCDIFFNDYFTKNFYSRTKFDIVCSIAMFYDVPNPHDFIDGIKQNLSEEGIWIIQLTDNLSMFITNEIGNVCHEHIAYYSLEVLNNLMKQHRLRIFDVSYNKTNGSSLRIAICHEKSFRQNNDSVDLSLSFEKNIFDIYNWSSFKEKCDKNAVKIKNYISLFGEKIVGMGASTKANTLLQLFNLTNNEIECILEVSPDKFGKFAVNSKIPIVEESEGLAKKPKIIMILIWQFTDFIIKKHKKFLEDGGIFLVPMPTPRLITKDGETCI